MHASLSAIPLQAEFARALPELSHRAEALRPEHPELLILNEELAVELGLDPAWLRSEQGVRFLLGNDLPPGATPVAQAYAGHQFGTFTPMLGDGRALLLGELRDRAGNLKDVHLKGSGPTPFTRGDGFATVAAMLREYIMGEAMHALGIPTTRALAVVATGRRIARDELVDLVPAGVLVRVASSHIRVGTFQYVAASRDLDLLGRLVDFSLGRHFPEFAGSKQPALALLEHVLARQAELVTSWMLVGFVHGVMNTDNMTVSGETIDYGPCAFIDAYDPTAVFSSIDHAGRYAYGNQPAIAQWNLTRFAETLLPTISPDLEDAKAAAIEVLETFSSRVDEAWVRGFRRKLGLSTEHPSDAEVMQLMGQMLGDAQAHRVDYTRFFRLLADAGRGGGRTLAGWFGDSTLEDREWMKQWRGLAPDTIAMDQANPAIIPRNQLVDEAAQAAHSGDLAPAQELIERVKQPFQHQGAADRYALPAPPELGRHITYCGT